MDVLAAVILVLLATVSASLVLLGLPGIWLMILMALGIDLWRPELMTNAAFIVLFVLAFLAEVAEFIASAVGAKKAGGSTRAAIGAIIGSIAGALTLGGAFSVVPVIGTFIGVIIGGAIGAAIGAVVLELTKETKGDGSPKEPGHTVRVGTGAFVGRLLSTVIKGGFAFVALVVLIVSVSVRGF